MLAALALLFCYVARASQLGLPYKYYNLGELKEPHRFLMYDRCLRPDCNNSPITELSFCAYVFRPVKTGTENLLMLLQDRKPIFQLELGDEKIYLKQTARGEECSSRPSPPVKKWFAICVSWEQANGRFRWDYAIEDDLDWYSHTCTLGTGITIPSNSVLILGDNMMGYYANFNMWEKDIFKDAVGYSAVMTFQCHRGSDLIISFDTKGWITYPLQKEPCESNSCESITGFRQPGNLTQCHSILLPY